jgi:hypothetical protein
LPQLSSRDVWSSLICGAVAWLAFALVCLHATHRGGPVWLEGRELALFLKLTLATIAFVMIDLAWKARASEA